MKLKKLRKIIEGCPLEVELEDDNWPPVTYKYIRRFRAQILTEVFDKNILLKYFPFVRKIQSEYNKYILEFSKKKLGRFFI